MLAVFFAVKLQQFTGKRLGEMSLQPLPQRVVGFCQVAALIRYAYT
jgi:hypothetical protein